MKKLIVFLILFIGLGISQARADTEVASYPSYAGQTLYKDYGDKKRVFVARQYYGFQLLDENGTLLQNLNYVDVRTAGVDWDVPTTTDFIELLNGDVLIIGNLADFDSSSVRGGVGLIMYYDHINDIILHINYGMSGSGVSTCRTKQYGALVDNTLVFRTYAQYVNNSNCSQKRISTIKQIDLSKKPGETDFIVEYVGNLETADLKLLGGGNYGKITDGEFIYKNGQYLYGYQCSEDFGGFCDTVERLNVGTGSIINGFGVLGNGIDMSAFSVNYTDDLGVKQFYSNMLFNGPNEFNDYYIQYYNYNNNIAYGINESILSSLEFVPDLSGNPKIGVVNNNDNAYYLYKSGLKQYLHTTADLFDDAVTVGEVGGGTDPGTDPGTGTGGTVEYDETIWNFDLDGDGEVGLLNGEIFEAIGNMFKYFFDSLMNFFANIKALVEKLNGIFTTEVKTFSFIPSASAYENGLTTALNGIGGEGYDETFLGKFDGFIRAFVYFFIFIVGTVVFIGINRKKND